MEEKMRLEGAVCPTGENRFPQVSLLLSLSLGSAKVQEVTPDDSMCRSTDVQMSRASPGDGGKCGTW